MASMAELAFSDDQLTFDYVKGEHLKCVLRIKNPTDQYALLKVSVRTSSSNSQGQSTTS